MLVALAVPLVLARAPSQVAGAAEALKVGVSAVAPGQGGLLMARDAGLFRAEGLEVEFLFFASSTEGAQALVSRGVPLAVMGAAAPVAAALAGADTVLVGGLLNTMAGVLVGGPGVETPAALRGKVVGINRFGSSSDLATRFALGRLGLDPERDVTLLQLGGANATRLAALQAGTIQAGLLEPTTLATSRKLRLPELVDLGSLGFVYPLEAVATSRRFVRERPDTLRRFVRGLVLGIHAYRTRPDDAKRVLRSYLKIDDPEVLTIAYDFYSQVVERKPYIPLDGVRTVLRELAAQNPRARTAGPEDFLDLSFVKQLDDSGFIDGLYR